MTGIGVMYMGCSERKWCADAEESVCTALLEDILAGGNFSVKEKSRRSQVMLIQNKNTKSVSKRDMLLNAARSAHRKTLQTYPVCKKVPVLLPFGWVLVVARYLAGVKSGKKNNILNKDSFKEAVHRKELYRELKLYEQQGNSSKTE